MLLLALRRVAFSLFSLLVVSLVLFLLTRSIPDSPARIVLGDQATEEQIAQFDRDHDLDRPVVAQYLSWLRRLLFHADLGRSFTTGLDMNRQIANTLPWPALRATLTRGQAAPAAAAPRRAGRRSAG